VPDVPAVPAAPAAHAVPDVDVVADVVVAFFVAAADVVDVGLRQSGTDIVLWHPIVGIHKTTVSYSFMQYRKRSISRNDTIRELSCIVIFNNRCINKSGVGALNTSEIGFEMTIVATRYSTFGQEYIPVQARNAGWIEGVVGRHVRSVINFVKRIIGLYIILFAGYGE
jgi:hypothetical protein